MLRFQGCTMVAFVKLVNCKVPSMQLIKYAGKHLPTFLLTQTTLTTIYHQLDSKVTNYLLDLNSTARFNVSMLGFSSTSNERKRCHEISSLFEMTFFKFARFQFN
jgi:hypothetical protein